MSTVPFWRNTRRLGKIWGASAAACATPAGVGCSVTRENPSPVVLQISGDGVVTSGGCNLPAAVLTMAESEDAATRGEGCVSRRMAVLPAPLGR